MSEHKSLDSGEDDVLTGPLAEAVQIVRNKTVPGEAIAGVIARATQLQDTNSKRPTLYSAVPTPRGYLGWATAGIGASLAAAVIAIWGLSGATTLTFADVQAALEEVRTAIISTKYRQLPENNHRTLVSADHKLRRTEFSNGLVVVSSTNGKTLMLNSKEMTAKVGPGGGFGRAGEPDTPATQLQRLAKIEKDAVKSLGTKAFDGRELVGFEVPFDPRVWLENKDIMVHRVWVDPESRLPVRAEQVLRDPNDKSLARGASVTTYEFNVPLEESLFSLSPPDGYQLVKPLDFRVPGVKKPEAPKDLDPTTLTIVPGRGIGDARFGMSLKEVIGVFGKADHVEPYRKPTPNEDRAVAELLKRAEKEKWDEFERNREFRRLLNVVPENRRWDGQFLEYHSLGFGLSVSNDKGFYGITCWSEKHPKYVAFAGKTAQEINIHSTLDEVEEAYGEPSKTDEQQIPQFGRLLHLYYESQNLSFEFRDGSLFEISAYRANK